MKKLRGKDREKMLEELRRQVIEKDKQLKESIETEELFKANKEALIEMTDLSEEDIHLIEKSIEAKYIFKRIRKRKILIWTCSIIVIATVIVLMKFTFFNKQINHTAGNTEPILAKEDKIKNAYTEESWIYDKNLWSQDETAIELTKTGKDAIAWFDKKIENNVTITFDWFSNSPAFQKTHINCILFGNGALKGNFWKDGVIVSYTYFSEDKCESWIRLNGIYSEVEFVNIETGLPYFEPGKTHHCKIVYEDDLLSFYIDNKPIQVNVLTDFKNKTGYFGIGTSWMLKHTFKISNVRIHSE